MHSPVGLSVVEVTERILFSVSLHKVFIRMTLTFYRVEELSTHKCPEFVEFWWAPSMPEVIIPKSFHDRLGSEKSPSNARSTILNSAFGLLVGMYILSFGKDPFERQRAAQWYFLFRDSKLLESRENFLEITRTRKVFGRRVQQVADLLIEKARLVSKKLSSP